MSILTTILATIVAIEHLYIFYLESLITTSQKTSQTFQIDQKELARPSVTSLFKNQGIYNALIALFLLYGIYWAHRLEIVTLFVVYVIVVAAYGSMTAQKSILLKQGGPAILTLLSIVFFH